MGMPKADVLDRVDADLARGHTAPAIQRLSSLVAAHPTDLDLRRRLAAVHRMIGNQIEAGRWEYLHADADPHATAAFERAYPSASHRLREVRWPADGQAATEFARHRLATLTDTAPASGSRPAQRRPVRPAKAVSRRRLLAVVLALATPLAVLGAVTVVQWLVG